MDRIKTGLRKIPIPAAFVICSLTALLAALSLTRATMWFAQKSKDEITASYSSMESIPWEPVQELQPSPPELTDPEAIPFVEAQPNESTPSMEVKPDNPVPSTETQPDESVSSMEDMPDDPTPSLEGIPDDLTPSTNGTPGESLSSTDALDNEQTPVQAEKPEQEQRAALYVMPPGVEIELPAEERKKYDFYEELDNAAAIFWYSVCLCLASLVFYLWKIKTPLHTLNQAARKISNNDLNFQIDYNGQDELGRLCQAFEVMRQELVQNNRKMWNSVEERKRLNAAFAHDMRTPLTVLQGHTDMLLDTLADGQDANQEILLSVQTISNQIARLNSYMDTMNALRRLEDYEPSLRTISSEALLELLEDTAASLFPQKNTSMIKTEIISEMDEQELWIDKEAFSQIFENLLSNAARYARESIRIRLYREQDFVGLEVADDGIGFTGKDLKNAFAPYYRGERNMPASSAHFGLGLYICNLLAEKLGGGIQLANGENGGAKVTVKLISYQKNFQEKL